MPTVATQTQHPKPPPEDDWPPARPRFTVRHLMILVAASGVALGFALALSRRHEQFRRRSDAHYRAGSALMQRHQLPFDRPSQFSRRDAGDALSSRGPDVARAFRWARFHWEQGEKYAEAADRPWLPVAPRPARAEMKACGLPTRDSRGKIVPIKRGTCMEPTTTEARPRRRWLRLSVRGLMLLVLAVGGGIGWKANRASYQRRAVAAIKEGGGMVTYDFQKYRNPALSKQKGEEPAGPRWLRRWLGDEYFQEVVHVNFYQRPPTPELLGVVAGLDGVNELFLYKMTGSAGLDHLPEMGRLKTLLIEGSGIDDAAMAEVSRVAALEQLTINKARLTDAGLARLLALPRLGSIGMTDVLGPTDAGVARLAALPGLRSLGLHNIPGVGDLVLAAIRENHRDMEALVFDRGRVSDAGLANIAGMKDLRALNLQGTQVTDVGLANIRGLVELESLFINVEGVTDAGLGNVQDLKKLAVLMLGSSKITDAGLARLADKVELQTLFLSGTSVSDDGLVHLGGLAKLDNLSLMRTAVTDAGLIHLQPLKALKTLNLRGTKVTPEGVAALRAALPSVRVTSGPIPPRKPAPAAK